MSRFSFYIYYSLGINNCGDNSDESHCSFECKHGEYFCHPKGCVSSEKLCDGKLIYLRNNEIKTKNENFMEF